MYMYLWTHIYICTLKGAYVYVHKYFAEKACGHAVYT